MRHFGNVVATVREFERDGQKQKIRRTVGVVMRDDRTGALSLRLDLMPTSPSWSGWFAIEPADPATSAPGDGHAAPDAAVEAAALERLRDAGDDAELATVWSETKAEYSRLGLEVPPAVRECWKLRSGPDAIAAEDAPDVRDADPAWLAGYDGAGAPRD